MRILFVSSPARRPGRRGIASGLNQGFPRWPEAGWRRQTGLMQVGNSIKRSQPPAEKAGTAMYEDDEDRIDAAEQLAEHNPRDAAEAFSAIACDRTVGDEVRRSAAEHLAALNPTA